MVLKKYCIYLTFDFVTKDGKLDDTVQVMLFYTGIF